jgi:hypothetical protein
MNRYKVTLTIEVSVLAENEADAQKRVERQLDDSYLGTPYIWQIPDGHTELQYDMETTVGTVERQRVCKLKNCKIEGEIIGTFPVEVDPVTGDERGPV